MAYATCPICDRRLTWAGRGRKPCFCSEKCRAQSQRIRRRLRKAGTPATSYDDIRKAEQARRDRIAARASEKEQHLAQLPPFQRAIVEAKREAKAARQQYLDHFGAGWTVQHRAEFERWCEFKTRLHRINWTGDPEDESLFAYDACEADHALITAKESAIKELRAQGDSEAAADLGAVEDFWQPRIWRRHWLRRLLRGADASVFPNGEPDWLAVASVKHQDINQVAREAFECRLREVLQQQWDQPCLPQSEAPVFVPMEWRAPKELVPEAPAAACEWI